jgi:NADH dehydrogenase
MVIELPDGLAYLQARFMEWLPNPPLSRDNLDSMKIDSVMAGAVAPALGVHPVAMEAVVPGYMSGVSPRERYMKLRDHAGR